MTTEEDQVEQDQVEQIKEENESLKKPVTLRCKVSSKGGLSVYGMGRFPVTLYKTQWLRLLGAADDIRAFMAKHDDELIVRLTKKEQAAEEEGE